MIREPYSVYPYNTTLDLSKVPNFQFVFSGDELQEYDYEILENNNRKNIIKPFNKLKTVPKNTIFNNSEVVVSHQLQDKLPSIENKDLIWRLRLVENKGDWTSNNIPTMPLIQHKTVDSLTSLGILTGPVCGQLENLSSGLSGENRAVDLEQGTVSTAIALANGSKKYFRIQEYTSKYFEYYPTAKGSFKIGDISKSTSEKVNICTIEEGINRNNGGFIYHTVTREEEKLEPLILKDGSGYFQPENIFTQEEASAILKKSRTTNYSFTSETFKDDGSSGQTTISNIQALKEFGYMPVTAENVGYIVSSTVLKNNSGTIFTSRVTRESLGLSPKLYIQYTKTISSGSTTRTEHIEKGYDNLFLKDEFTNAVQKEERVYTQKTVTNILNPEKITYMPFNEEIILYGLTQNTLTYNSKQYGLFLQGQGLYPQENEDVIQRKDKIPSNPTLVVQDASGHIFSSTTLFTEEEKRNIEDYSVGIYKLKPFAGSQSITPITSGEHATFSIYKNFYDTNYYYFKNRNKPIVVFCDEDNVPIPDTIIKLMSKYFFVKVQNQQEVNTKCYSWELLQKGTLRPIIETPKVFSKDIYFEYGNFLDENSYFLILKLETEDGAYYEYSLPQINVHFTGSETFNSSAEAIFNQADSCNDIIWPLQQASVPDFYGQLENDLQWKNQSGKYMAQKIVSGNLTYDNINGEPLSIDKDLFTLEIFFKLNCKFSDIVKYQNKNLFGKPILTIDNGLTGFNKKGFSLNASDSYGLGLQIIQTSIPTIMSFGSISNPQSGNIDHNNVLKLADVVYKLSVPTEEEIKNNRFNIFYLPPDNFSLDNSGFLSDDDLDLSFTRYKLFFNNKQAFLIRYRDFQTGELRADYWGQSNDPPLLDLPINFNNVVLYPDCSFASLAIYQPANISTQMSLSDIVIKEGGLNTVSNPYWIPSWSNESNSKSIPAKDKIICIDFSLDFKSQNNVDIDGTILGFRIYRYKYSGHIPEILFNDQLRESELGLIGDSFTTRYDQELLAITKDIGNWQDQELIADLPTEEITRINNNNDFLLKDYTAHNRGCFKYEITPKIRNSKGHIQILGKSINSNIVFTNDYAWVLTGFKKNQFGNTPTEQWKFLLNLSDSGYTHNINKTIHPGLGRYPKISITPSNFKTINLNCYIGNFAYSQKRSYINGIYITDQSITKDTSLIQPTRIYIQQTNQLENFSIQNDAAEIIIRNQSRKIINYGYEVDNYNRHFYVDILHPFSNFVPIVAKNDSQNSASKYTLKIVKNKNDQSLYSIDGNFSSYTDDINIVNKWNNFIVENNIMLVKDLKGNCFIGTISNNSETYNRDIDALPTTISFQITQLDSISNYKIFN